MQNKKLTRDLHIKTTEELQTNILQKNALDCYFCEMTITNTKHQMLTAPLSLSKESENLGSTELYYFITMFKSWTAVYFMTPSNHGNNAEETCRDSSIGWLLIFNISAQIWNLFINLEGQVQCENPCIAPGWKILATNWNPNPLLVALQCFKRCHLYPSNQQQNSLFTTPKQSHHKCKWFVLTWQGVRVRAKNMY